MIDKLSISILFTLQLMAPMMFCSAQENLVPNPSFEEVVTNDFICPNKGDDWDKIIEWTFLDKKLGCKAGTADWESDYCNGPVNSNKARTGTAWASCLIIPSQKKDTYYEYITTKLKNKLVTGKKYYVEFYVRAENGRGNTFGALFTLEKVRQECPMGAMVDIKPEVENPSSRFIYTSDDWVKVSGTFTANNAYEWITIGSFDKNFKDDGYFHFDDVRVFETCSPELNIENTIYDNENTTYEANVIRAGFDVGAPTTNGNVVVKSNSDIGYKGVTQIVLKPGFSVEAGGKFHAYLAPCGAECFPPVAIAGENKTICDGSCYGLGTTPVYGTTYSWISEPLSAIDYLSDPFISNPEFCPPPTGYGVIKYTLRAVNKCGESATKTIVVRYDNQPNPTPTVNVTNILYGDFISFDVTSGPQVDEVQIKVCNTTNTLCKIYTYKRDIDFACCSFRWTVPEYFTMCNDYIITVSAKNICDNNIASTIVNWDRDRTINIIKLPNVYFTYNGSYCVEVTGAENYDITIYSRHGGGRIVHKSSGLIKGKNPLCIWNGTCNFFSNFCSSGETVVDGIYDVIIIFSNCVTIKRVAYFVHVYNRRPENKKEIDLPVSPDTLTLLSNIGIYPNPNEGRFTVYLSDINQIIQVYDVLGNLVSRPENKNEAVVEMDIAALPKGIYFVKITGTDGSVTVKKVVYQ